MPKFHNFFRKFEISKFFDLAFIFDPWYGNCWTFNSGLNSTSCQRVPIALSSLPAEVYGLQMSFYVNYYRNLSQINTILGGLGALIRIENSSYLTNDNLRTSSEPPHELILKRSCSEIS